MINNYYYQSEANVQCLLEDIEYSERADTFFKLFNEFDAAGVRWALACSMNLFLRGIVDEFHDLDLLVEIKDIPKVKEIMKKCDAVFVATGGNGFCESDIYLHYQFGRVDIDIISGFRIVTFGTYFLYEYSEEEIDYILVENKKIPLVSMEALYILYSMMEGWQQKRRFKRVLIEEYLLSENVKHGKILKDALEQFQLPGWIKRNIRDVLYWKM